MMTTHTTKRFSLASISIVLAAALAACGGNNDLPSETSRLAPAPLMTTPSKIEVFSGKRNQYQILQSANGFVVRDLVGNEGAREITGVDTLKFSDLTVNLKIGNLARTISDDALKSIIELYVAFFNRVPDADGLAFWIQQYKDGATMREIADHFYRSALIYSSSTGYTTNQSNADFVKLIYKNVLGRTGATEPPAQDVQFWVDHLEKSTTTKGSLVISMLYSAHTFEGDPQFGWVPDLLNNKIATARFFSIEQGITYLTPEDSIKKGIDIASAVTPSSNNAAKIAIGINDFGFNLSGKNTLVENLNNSGILTDSKGENHPLRVTLQLDLNGNITTGNYDYRYYRGSMRPCTLEMNNADTCIGMRSSFSKIKQSAPLTLAGATSGTSYLVVQDASGDVFTGEVNGNVWSGSWTKVATPNSASDFGKFSVLLDLKSSKNTTQSYNVQDLMLQFYSERRTWFLMGETFDVATGISGIFESIPFANNGGTFSIDGQILKQMDTSLKTAIGTETLANAKASIRHLNYSPITAQIGLVTLEPSGMEFYLSSKDPSTFFPTNAKMGDSGKNGSSENRAGYPNNMSVTSNTNYSWNLVQEFGRDLLCLNTEEIAIPTGVKGKISRCHQINPDGKLGDYLSITNRNYLASGTFTGGYSMETK